MAYAYVKFICDGVKMTVPISFIKNFNRNEFVPGTKHPVFWSPVDGQTPQDVERFQAKVVEIEKLSHKETKPLAAYYAAEVLLVADSKQKLESALKDKRVIVPSHKKSENLNELKPRSAAGRKRKEKSTDYVSKDKQKKVIKIGEKSLVAEWKKKFPKNNESSEESSNSEEELIPKAKLKAAEEKLAILERNAEKLQKKVDKLQGARQAELTSNKQNEEPLKFICTEEADQNVSDPHAENDGLPVSVASSSSEHKSIEEKSLVESEKGSVTPKKQQKPAVQLNLNITPTKMKKVLRGVKPNFAGDSQFVKNLAVMVFTIPLLLKSSVSGAASSRSKGSPKPALPLAGMEFIEKSLEQRLDKDSVSATEKQMRMARIGHYVSEKINDLHKGLKRQKGKALAAAAAANQDSEAREE